MAEGWAVTAQRQTTRLGADGRFHNVMEVTYRTDEGVTGHVDIDLNRYSADYVRDQINDVVKHITDVHNL